MNSKWKQNDRNQNSPLIITFIEELFSWVLIFFAVSLLMNLCITEELRGGNVCFYRLPAASVDTENWKALVETKTRVSSKADFEAKKKNVRLNKWSGIATFCILNKYNIHVHQSFWR